MTREKRILTMFEEVKKAQKLIKTRLSKKTNVDQKLLGKYNEVIDEYMEKSVRATLHRITKLTTNYSGKKTLLQKTLDQEFKVKGQTVSLGAYFDSIAAHLKEIEAIEADK